MNIVVGTVKVAAGTVGAVVGGAIVGGSGVTEVVTGGVATPVAVPALVGGVALVVGSGVVATDGVRQIGDGIKGLVSGDGDGTENNASGPRGGMMSEARESGKGGGKEHTKGARPSTTGKHQEGQARKGRDAGGEKGDVRRRPPRPAGWTQRPMAPEERLVMDSNYELALKIADAEPDEEEPQRVLDLLDLGIEEGDERAVYARAVCFFNGTYGSVIDEAKAFDLFLKLSESSIPEVLFDLAVCYDLGQVVSKDQFVAFEYYLRAATLGHQEACSQVSEFFREGATVPESENLQNFWLKRSQKKESEISPADRVWLR